MAVFDFTGADGDSLPAGLIAQQGTFEISNNQLTATGTDPGDIDWVALIDDVDPTFPVSATVGNVVNGSSKNHGVVHHYNPTDNSFIFFGVRAQDGLARVYKRVGGAFTLIDSYTIPSYIPDTPVILEIRPIDGATAGVYDRYECLIDGTVVITADIVDAGIDKSSNYAGVRIGETNVFLDDFTYTSTSSTGPTDPDPEPEPTDPVAVSIELIGPRRNNIFVGESFTDLGALVTYDDASTATIYATSGTIDNTGKSTNYLYYNAGDGVAEVSRIIKVMALEETPAAGTKSLRGIRSWWMGNLDVVRGNSLFSGYTDENGEQGIAEFNATTLDLIRNRPLQDALYPDDGHNSVPFIFTSTGRLITLFTGHATDRDGNKDGTYFSAESSDGTLAGFGTNVVRHTDLGVIRSNYVQLFENSQGTILAISAEDEGASKWFPLFRTGVNQWSAERCLIDLGTERTNGEEQYYVKAVMLDNDRLRMFGIPHASNLENPLSLCEYDTVTKDLYTGPSTVAGNSGTGSPSSSCIIGAESAPNIYQPAAGRAMRVLDASLDGLMVMFAEYDDADGANGEYNLLYCTDEANRFSSSAWTKKLVCNFNTSSFIDLSRKYIAGGSIAKEVAGVGINVARNDGANNIIERYYADSITDNFTSETVFTTTSKIVRPESPLNATETANIVFSQGSYSSYVSFGQNLQVAEWETPQSQLVVEVPNQPPTANAGPDQSVAAATQFTLDGTGSQDTDGTIVEWRWTQTTGDTVTLDLEDPARPTATSPSKTTAQRLTFQLVTIDDEDAVSSPSLVNIDVAAVVQNDVLNIIDKISFTFESDGMITAFPGRANRETFRLKPSDPTGLVLEDGWFDFEANDVRRVEISMLETTGVKIISTDTDSITRERSKLHVRMGDMPIKSSTKEFEPTISVFVGDDERGVVMTAPGLSGAPKVKYYSTTARAV